MSESIGNVTEATASMTIAPTSPHSHQQQQQHLTPLSNDSNAYSFIEYFLRLSMHASTAKILSSWEVSNPQLTLQFEKRSQNLLTIDSWVDLSTLGEAGCEEELIRSGFGPHLAGSNNGIKFSVGQIKVSEGEEPIRKKFLLCKVAIGRAYNSTEDFAKIAAIPDAYDSFVLDRREAAPSSSSNNNANGGCCGGHATASPSTVNEYIVKDAAQILPTYVVSVEYDPVVERRSRQQLACENCEEAPATVFCQADAANLCASCDAAMHATKLAARHVRIALDQGPQTFACCRVHPDKLVEFFCPSCSKPVCVHCKMVGHHSVGEAARHKLITVAEAFRSVSEASAASDPVLESRRTAIHHQIESVNECARAVEANAAQVQQALEDLYRKAQNDLKTITKKKLNVLKGDVVELNRQLGELARLESFLDYQKAGGNATQFILDWAHHQRLRAELHSFAHFREAIDVQPDIRINGAIQVHVESAGMPLSPAQQQDQSQGHYEHVLGTASMKASALFDSQSKPKYSQSRNRPLPTFDLGVYAKNRKASDYVTPAQPLTDSPTKN